MESRPWTIKAFELRRRRTWKAIRIWLIFLLIGVVGFSVPFFLEKQHVRVEDTGTRVRWQLSLDDMTGGELLMSLFSFVAFGAGGIGVTMGVKHYYRCPKCEEVPVRMGNGFRQAKYGAQSGIAIMPAVCPNCGAVLK